MKVWSKGINGIRFVKNLPGPAAVHRRSGVILLNPTIWKKLTIDQRYFVLLHEWAHIDLKSSNEVAVDHHAFKEYAKRHYRLSQAVKALTQILSFRSPEHMFRSKRMLQRAIAFDNQNK